jgi:hypothetical protein
MKSLLTAAFLSALFGVSAIAQPDARGEYSEVSCNVPGGNAANIDGARSSGRCTLDVTPRGQRWRDGYASETGPADEFGRDPDPAVRLQLRKDRDSWSH